ncbi:MAG TPA: hypothetical protein VEQ85_14785, partial [Lacipirellulaceae bacterium]|nr:hypothetical protein [Lacipirellulaceae bacterium]
MSDLTTTTPDQVVAACQANAADAAEALTRALDGAFAIQAPKSQAPAATAQAPDGPGLLVMLTVGGAGLAIALPESAGMLPAWYSAPDATGESKLTTLAQELSMLLVPETLSVDKFEARRVESLAAALRSAGAAPESSLVSLAATKGATAGEISIVWPLGAP